MKLDPAMARRFRARQSQRTGSDFQTAVANRMMALGCLCVEQVATPMFKIRGIWKHGRKVSCDVKAVLQGGRAVFVEAKWRPGENLVWSDLEDHQHKRLTEALQAGAVALVAYSDGRRGLLLLDYDHLVNVVKWRPRSHLSEHDVEVAARAGLYRLGIDKPESLALREVPHH